MYIVPHCQYLRLERMLFYLKQRVLCSYLRIFFEITPDILQRVFTLLDIEYEVEDLAETGHDFTIEDAVDGKLGAVEDGEDAPYFELLDFRVFGFF